MNHRNALDRYATLFESVSPDDIPRLHDWFATDARFKDPFNDVRGIDAIRHVFSRMFETCLDVDFTVHERFLENDIGCLTWTLCFRPDVAGLRKRRWHIEGASRIRFNAEGKIIEHIDYWDSGEYFLARLPFIGTLVRLIRRRVA